MPPDSSSFTALNIPNDAVPEWMGSFTLAAPPNTDLWRKPPSRDTSTAPILFTALRNPFIAAEVTVSADWELEWDQGGLVIFAGAPPGRVATTTTPQVQPVSSTTSSTTTSTSTSTTSPATTTTSSSTIGPPSASAGAPPPSSTTTPTTTTSTTTRGAADNPPPATTTSSTGTGTAHNAGQTSGVVTRDIRGPPPAYVPPAPASKWVKVGLEFCNNACHATSVCATSDGADWALTALPPHHARRTDLRIKIERIGYALWVWYEDEVSGWKKLREVTWFFWGVEDKAVRVGVYASRPANFGTTFYERRHGGPSVTQRNLCVDFEGLEIF